MRIGCLQFAPKSDTVDHNMNRADKILCRSGVHGDLSIATESELNVLVLPKLAFSGSNFRSKSDVQRFLEPAAAGDTQLWARTAAIKYNCHVVVGYPQQLDIAGGKSTSKEYLSSSIMVDAAGNTLVNNTGRAESGRKQAFSDCRRKRLGNVSIGQYTDLSDDEFSKPKEREAFARHILRNKIGIAIISLAWETTAEQEKFSSEPENPDMEALLCWARFLRPLVEAKLKQEVFVVLCNRSGSDGEATYAGTSAVLGIRDGEVHVYGLLGGGTEDLLVVDTSDGPIFTLPLDWEQPGSKGKQATEFCNDAEWLQPESHPSGTSNKKFDTAQESSQKHIVDERGIPSLQNAFPAVGVYPPAGSPRQAKKQPRPKLFIPESAYETPQEIPVGKYRIRATAVPDSKASAATVRPLGDSTPFPHEGNLRRRHWPSHLVGSVWSPKIGVPPSTPFDDFTAISVSSDGWNGEWPSLSPDRGSSYSTGQSSSADTTVSDFKSLSGTNIGRFERPRSPKSRNADILASLELHGGEADCGRIPILASPSIVATDSEKGRGSEGNRGRRRRPERPLEEESRCSSNDSTHNGQLHRSVRRSDSGDDDVRQGASQRSKSTSGARPKGFSRSLSLPATRRGRSQDLQATNNSMAPRAGFQSWPIFKEELQRARAEIHERLLNHVR